MAGPHDGDDPRPCVCRHITCRTQYGAILDGGRYWDPRVRRWICYGGCGGDHGQTARVHRDTDGSWWISDDDLPFPEWADGAVGYDSPREAIAAARQSGFEAFRLEGCGRRVSL